MDYLFAHIASLELNRVNVVGLNVDFLWNVKCDMQKDE